MPGKNVADVYPLTPLQEGLLFHCLYNADPALYVTSFACTLDGLDEEAFVSAWQRAVDRHAVLRTAFVWEGQRKPVQVVGRQTAVPWRSEDWRLLLPAERERQWEEALRTDAGRLGKLNRAPLVRLSLFRTGQSEHRFLFSHHHLILDGWSLPLLLDEVFSLYRLGRNGGGELPPVRPFRDYVSWLRRQDLAAAERSWRETLCGYSRPLQLGADRGTPGMPVRQVATELVHWGREESAALHQAAKSHGLTLSTVVAGGFSLLLARESGEDDLVFGMSVAGRPPALPDVDRMIGIFTNTLPLRVRVPAAQPALAWLRQLQESLLAMRRYEHSPLVQVQKWSEVPAGQPLFEPILILDNHPSAHGAAERHGVRVREIRSSLRTSCPLLATVATGERLTLALTYDRERFSPLAVARLLRHWQKLLGGLAGGLAAPLGTVAWWSPAERQQILFEWNDTAALPGPDPAAVHLGFAEWAAAIPDAIAVCQAGRFLTYGELLRRAAATARRLRRLGIGAERLAGVVLERSPEAIVALLAVLTAGGPYLPLDPRLPDERLRWLLADAAPRVLLSAARWSARLAGCGLPVVALDSAMEGEGYDEPAGAMDDPIDGAPPAWLSPDQMAYLLYTSGSTGQPKGVMIAHRSLANHVAASIRRDRLAPGDRVLQFAALSFDVSAEEIYTCLGAGATLVLREEEMLESPARFFALCRERAITVLNLPTAFWHEVAGALPAVGELPPSVRLTLIAGEQALPEPVARWGARMGPAVRLVNHYGPTEGTITPIAAEIGELARTGRRLAAVPIGRPIAGTGALVLDREMSPVPIGVAGDLYLAGACLARGYHRRPDLTAVSFVPDPSRGRAGERLYRTGDLARLREDGEIEFLGRVDQQVKVRGFRVEPGEIEALLGQHPAVGSCAVVARPHGGHLRLIAYAAPPSPGAPLPASGALRRFLEERLPDYMVPSLFVLLDSLPRNASGKLDRRQLPAPEPSAGDGEAPRDPVEQRLAAIWSEVLGVERVGVHDSFFELGGDSILSIQASSRAQAAGLAVTPQRIFERRTIAALAGLVREAGGERLPETSRPLGGRVPLTPMQRRFLAACPPEPHHFNQALLLAVERGQVPARLAARVAALPERHDALAMRYLWRAGTKLASAEGREEASRQAPGAGTEGEGSWVQEAGAPEEGARAHTVDLEALTPERWRGALAAVAADAQRSLALDSGPLLRALYLPGPGEGRDRLLLVAHHLVVDGVSWRILLAEMAGWPRVGAASAAVDPASEAARGTRFQEWAERLEAAAGSAELAAERSWWEGELGPAAALPTDFAGENTAGSARTLVVSLDAGDTAALLREAPAAYFTEINDLLVAALARTLGRWAGGGAVRLELEGHGREEEALPGAERAELGHTVGWLTSIFPVRLEVSGLAEDGALIRAVKEKLRRIPRRGLGFGLLSPPVAAAEVVFNYLGQLDRVLPAGTWLRPAAEPVGPLRSPLQRREHLLEINGAIQEGRLQLAWTFSAGRHRAETVAALAERTIADLAALIHHCRRQPAGRHTPSDFLGFGLDLLQKDLDRLHERLPGGLEDLYPLSPLQQGMHFHAAFEPDSEVYLSQVSAILQGDLVPAALRRAWETVVARHPALRTSLVTDLGDEPLQAVAREVGLDWQEQDWRLEEPSAVSGRWQTLLAEELRRGFDLDRPPLFRFVLVRTAADRQLFAWTVHHLVVDGWSEARIFAEVFELYAAFVRGDEPALPPAPRYRDYIEWLRRQDLAAAEDFWRRELRGFTAPTPLAWSRPAGAAGGTGAAGGPRLGGLERRLDPGLSARLAGLARRSELTLNTLLIGLWAIVLARVSGEPEVVFGSAVAGRPVELPGLAAAVGLFINTLPVRVAVPLEEGLLAWLERLQERLIAARRYEYSPLVEVQGWSEVPRGQPLFESLVVFENYPLPSSLAPDEGTWAVPQAGRIEIRDLRNHDRVSYPLSLQIVPGEALLLQLQFEAGRFAEEAMAELLRQLDGLCRQLVDEPRQRLGELSLVTAEAPLPDPASPLATPEQVPVSEQVRAVAARYPQMMAVRQGERGWSYAELAAAAWDLAAQLAACGGWRRGTVVAVAGERSFGLIAAMVAVLAGGGVLLTLDERLPAERRRRMLEEAGARLLLFAGDASGEAMEGGTVERWPLDPGTGRRIESGGAVRAATAPVRSSRGEEPAYLFFTSGTTAAPRAVLGCHRGLAHFVAWQRDAVAAGPGDRVAQLTGLSFDVVLREIFLPLTSGATLCLPALGGRPAHELDPGEVLSWLASEGATLLHAVPTLATAWLDAAPEGPPLAALRAVFFAGEPLTDALVRRWRRRVSRDARLLNLYGPTETTLAKCCYEVPADPPPGVQPVGLPLPETQALVLSPDGRRCGVGEPGEIVIRTPFRTLGYVNAPEENRRRFVANPFRRDPDDLVYRTGDRGRYRADGLLEILGRLDEQVKVRGVRIDPNEIAAVLQEHPSVGAATVMAVADPRGETALAAYVAPAVGAELAPAALRVFALQRLPLALVPALVVILPRLPRTANGKVDRSALPAPVWPLGEGGLAAPPLAADEEIVAAIWAEVLGREGVGAEESFFELAGHSLLAARIVARIQRAFGVDLPLRQIFDEPTVRGTARAVRERLRRRGSAAGSALPDPPPLLPSPPGAPPVLSFAQERLWVLEHLEPGTALYNLHSGVRLRGRLDARRLARCLAAVAARHAPLRTGFVTVHGEGRPEVEAAERCRPALPQVSLASLPPAAAAAELGRLGGAQAAWPFDLARPPLVRAWLVELGAAEHALLLTVHHIVADGWSIGLLTTEVAALYRGGPDAPALPPLPIAFGDFARWQRSWLAGEVLAAELAFWRDRLAGAPPILDLPTDRQRQLGRSFRSGRVTRLWGPELGAAVRRRVREAAASFSMVLTAALSVLLQRATGREDLVLGTAVAGRSRVELEPLIGLFVNSLVLRIDLTGDPGFGELIGRVRGVVLEAHAHQDLPFEKLVEELQPRRELGVNPLFQVMLVVQNTPAVAASTAGELTLERLGQEVGTARLDLTFSATETGDGIFLLADYPAGLFDGTTVRRLLGHLGELLAAGCADPSRRIGALPLLTAAERHQLSAEWNDTEADPPDSLDEMEAPGPIPTLHDLFWRQAERSPEAVALIAGETVWTYAELSREAGRLARRLRAMGVGPEVRVGLALPRSPELLAALLGVLTAGGAFVPLDLDQPAERLAEILAGSETAVVVSQGALAGRLAPALAAVGRRGAEPTGGPRLLLLDRPPSGEEGPAGRSGPGIFPQPVLPNGLAYVIYTSGSTGTPQGVMVPHSAVVNTLLWRRRTFPLTPGDRMLQNIALTFDPSVWQIFGAWAGGAALVLPRADGHKDLAYLAELMATSGVTVADFPPSVLRRLLDEPALSRAPLRHVFAGGEALSGALRDRFLLRPPGRAAALLHNVYGPTEGAIDATWWTCGSGDEGETVPIGRPVDGKQVWLADEELAPVPIGLTGELVLAGAGLARGYCARPDLTAERFRPHPSSPIPGARLYRTGDLARQRTDGRIEFAGRRDHQVKVLGVRIELGEIEQALAANPEVAEAAVAVLRSPAGEPRLVACFAPIEGARPEPRALAAWLRRRLPPTMLPAGLVPLAALPRTATGKLDRQELCGLAAAGEQRQEGARVEPRTAREALLAEVWCEVLGLPSVGVDDNFFAAGGDSILSIQIVARAARRGLRLAPRQLFEHQTIAELARIAGDADAMPEEEQEAGDSWPLSPIQRWFFARRPSEPWHFNQALLLALRQRLAPALLRRAFAHLLAHHDALRLRFDPSLETAEQRLAPEGEVPFAVVDLSQLGTERRPEADRERSALARSLDLAHGPICRITLFDYGPGSDPLLLLVVHHLAVDGVSWRILVEDLESACRQLQEEGTALLPPKTTSFRRWAARLAERAASAEMEAELGFWLALGAPVAPLPIDRREAPGEERPDLEADAAVVEVVMEAAETRALIEEVPAALHARSDEILIAALALAVTRWSGEAVLLLDLEGHGREEELVPGVDLSRSVGWFTSLYPVRLELAAGLPPAAAVSAVKARLRAMPLHGMGYGILRYLGRPEVAGSLAALPQAQLSFNYLGQIDRGADAGGLLRLAGGPLGGLRSPLWARPHPLEVDAAVGGGRLHVRWSYHPARHLRSTIERLAADFLVQLGAITAASRTPAESERRTLADFPLLRGGEEQLDRLLARFGPSQHPERP